MFLALTTDEIWGVRKACAEAIVTISSHCSKDARTEKLVGAYENLIKDVCDEEVENIFD